MRRMIGGRGFWRDPSPDGQSAREDAGTPSMRRCTRSGQGGVGLGRITRSASKRATSPIPIGRGAQRVMGAQISAGLMRSHTRHPVCRR